MFLYQEYSKFYLTGFLPTFSYMIPNMLFGNKNSKKTWCDMSMGWGDRLVSAILL